MFANLWFGTPIWIDSLKIKDIGSLKKYCEKLKFSDNGVARSNKNGYQSIAWKKKELSEQKIVELVHDLEEKAIFIIEKLGSYKKEIILSNLWINLNTKNSYNVWHTHPNSILSGILYLTHGSRILFRRPYDPMSYYLTNVLESHKDTEVTFDVVHYDPEPELLIFFPPWLEHCVEISDSFEPRISIAFNFIFKE